ncbi:hypothetical protein SAMN04487914_1593 [Arthrobacter sp. ok909]|nr:hypothetical protein SAMN04487914_1593 [Arthrobacter sp. ok909]
MLFTPVGVNRFSGRFGRLSQGRERTKRPETPEAQPGGCASGVSGRWRSCLGGEKSFAYSVLKAADVDARELRCPGLIAVDNRAEQFHVLMHVA